MAISDYLLGATGSDAYEVPMTIGDTLASQGKAFSNRLGTVLENPNIQRMLAETGAGLSAGQGIGEALGGASGNYARRKAFQEAQAGRDAQHSARMQELIRALQGEYGSTAIGPADDPTTADAMTITNDGITVKYPNTGSLQKAQGTKVAGEQMPLESRGSASWRNPSSVGAVPASRPNISASVGGGGVSYAGLDPEDIAALEQLRQGAADDESGVMNSILEKIDRDLAMKAAKDEAAARRQHDFSKMTYQQTLGLEELAARHGYDLDRMLADQAFRREIARMQIEAGREMTPAQMLSAYVSMRGQDAATTRTGMQIEAQAAEGAANREMQQILQDSRLTMQEKIAKMQDLTTRYGTDMRVGATLSEGAANREAARTEAEAARRLRREEGALTRGAQKERWVAEDERIRDLAADSAELKVKIAQINAGNGSKGELDRLNYELKNTEQRAKLAITLNNPDVDWNTRKRIAMSENLQAGQTSFWVPVDGSGGWFGPDDTVQSVQLPMIDGEQLTSDMLMNFLQANPKFSPMNAVDYWYLEAGQTPPFGTLKPKGGE